MIRSSSRSRAGPGCRAAQRTTRPGAGRHRKCQAQNQFAQVHRMAHKAVRTGSHQPAIGRGDPKARPRVSSDQKISSIARPDRPAMSRTCKFLLGELNRIGRKAAISPSHRPKCGHKPFGRRTAYRRYRPEHQVVQRFREPGQQDEGVPRRCQRARRSGTEAKKAENARRRWKQRMALQPSEQTDHDRVTITTMIVTRNGTK